MRIGYVTMALLERGFANAAEAEARALADATATQDRPFELGDATEYHAAAAGAMVATDPGFVFGRPKLHELGHDCCGKPQGCTNPTDGCAYQQHPYKRWVRGEITLDELNRLNPPRGSA